MHSIISFAMIFNQLKFIFIIVSSVTAAHGADYDDFAIVYGCNSGRGRHSRDDLIFVLSRDYKVTDTVQTRVEDALRRNGIDFLKAKPVKQGPRTPYTPNSRRCDRPSWGP